MKFITHITISAVIAALSYNFFGLYSILLFFSGFVFDIDHLIWYSWHYRSLNLWKCREYCYSIGHHKDTKRLLRMFFVFHNWEFVILLIALGFLWKGFFFVSLGAGIHLLLDIYDRHRIFGVWIPGSAIYYFLTRD